MDSRHEEDPLVTTQTSQEFWKAQRKKQRAIQARLTKIANAAVKAAEQIITDSEESDFLRWSIMNEAAKKLTKSAGKRKFSPPWEPLEGLGPGQVAMFEIQGRQVVVAGEVGVRGKIVAVGKTSITIRIPQRNIPSMII